MLQGRPQEDPKIGGNGGGIGGGVAPSNILIAPPLHNVVVFYVKIFDIIY